MNAVVVTYDTSRIARRGRATAEIGRRLGFATARDADLKQNYAPSVSSTPEMMTAPSHLIQRCVSASAAGAMCANRCLGDLRRTPTGPILSFQCAPRKHARVRQEIQHCCRRVHAKADSCFRKGCAMEAVLEGLSYVARNAENITVACGSVIRRNVPIVFHFRST